MSSGFLCPAGASRARPTARKHDGNRQRSQRQAHWRPGPLGGLVGHSKDGELSLCRDLGLAVSTGLPGTLLDWLAASPWLPLVVSCRAMIRVGRALYWLPSVHEVKVPSPPTSSSCPLDQLFTPRIFSLLS